MSTRTDRVASLLQKDLSAILYDYQKNNLITITNVSVSPDLGVAKVYISILGGDQKSTFSYLEEHVTNIRYKLSSKIRHQLRRMPELIFYLDDSAAYADKMEAIFSKLDIKPENDGYDEEE